MEHLPKPRNEPSLVPIGSLTGTVSSLASAAIRAGYTVHAETSDIGSVRLTGTMHGWGFRAIHRASGTWDVGIHRPGWPDTLSDVTTLRATLRAQTPSSIGKAA